MKKKYICDICGESYILKISLNLHIRYKCGDGCCADDFIMSYPPAQGTWGEPVGACDGVGDLCPENNPTMFKRKFKHTFD